MVRWVPTPEAQLRLQETAVASDQTQERAGFSPAHLPGLQGYCRDKSHRDAATGHCGL